MGHTYSVNFGHIVFHVDAVCLETADLADIFAYISAILRAKRVMHVLVGGIENHIHIIANFPMSASVSDIMREVKASSSYHIRHLRAAYHDFAWQQGYAYFSVSASNLETVKHYVLHQREHHLRMTVDNELSRLLSKHSTLVEKYADL